MNVDAYRISTKQPIDLGKYVTTADPACRKKEARDKLMPENIRKTASLQEKLYAENQHSLLIVLQAMDAAGKDGIIRHVMTGLNPQGTRVTSFKVPSREENDHDFLWRINKALPPRGEIGIFNRSHYEDVLVGRVHDLVKNSQMPPALITDRIWDQRYRHIRDFEQYLYENGTVIIKFFLHISKEEQRRRLLERINEPDKNWKFSSSDIYERRFWDQYKKAYEQMIENTATQQAPWYVIPADQKWFSRYLVSQIVLDTLQGINPQIPELSEDEKEKLEEGKRLLEADHS
jgi:PPK2 family polyphosphate:nucleotide phosphotransferase